MYYRLWMTENEGCPQSSKGKVRATVLHRRLGSHSSMRLEFILCQKTALDIWPLHRLHPIGVWVPNLLNFLTAGIGREKNLIECDVGFCSWPILMLLSSSISQCHCRAPFCSPDVAILLHLWIYPKMCPDFLLHNKIYRLTTFLYSFDVMLVMP